MKDYEFLNVTKIEQLIEIVTHAYEGSDDDDYDILKDS